VNVREAAPLVVSGDFKLILWYIVIKFASSAPHFLVPVIRLFWLQVWQVRLLVLCDCRYSIVFMIQESVLQRLHIREILWQKSMLSIYLFRCQQLSRLILIDCGNKFVCHRITLLDHEISGGHSFVWILFIFVRSEEILITVISLFKFSIICYLWTLFNLENPSGTRLDQRASLIGGIIIDVRFFINRGI
jgi:hypothetical protein